jgi:hypothetical protein
MTFTKTDGNLTTQLHDKPYNFNFSIVNFPYLCDNVQSPHAYDVDISQVIRYVRTYSSYDQFLNRCKILAYKLM